MQIVSSSNEVPARGRGVGWCVSEKMALLEARAKIGCDPGVRNGQKGPLYEKGIFEAFLEKNRAPSKEEWNASLAAGRRKWYGLQVKLMAKKAFSFVVELSKYYTTKERVESLNFDENPSEERINLTTSFAMRVGRVLCAELDQIVYRPDCLQTFDGACLDAGKYIAALHRGLESSGNYEGLGRVRSDCHARD